MPEKPADLSQIKAPPPEQVSKVPDQSTELDLAESRSDRLEIENEGLRQDISERKKYAHRAFCLMVVWLIAIAAILILQGFHICGFYLNEGVLVALLSSTSAGIIGIFYAVTRYLFHFDEPK